MKKYHLLVFVFLHLLAICYAAAEQQPILILKQRVNDLTHVLSEQQLQNLEQQIIKFEHNHPDGSQLALLIVPSLAKSMTIEEQANKIFNYWQLGQKGKDNGILMLIALNDRAVRIEVGYGLEGQLTDLRTKQIINQFLTPHFKQQNYYTGITQAISAIDRVITDPVHNILSNEQTKTAMYDFLLSLAAINALVISVCFLIIQMLKPTKFIANWIKSILILLTLTSILIFIYIIVYYSLSFMELLKAWGFVALLSLLLSIMILFAFSFIQIAIVLPSLNYLLNRTCRHLTNKVGKKGKIAIKIYSKTAIISTVLFIVAFALLPAMAQFFALLIGFLAAFILAIKYGRQGRSSGSSRSGGSSGGFSGGGGRSGGGGASGRW